MENIDQFELLYLNLFLLMLSSGIALYLPKRMKHNQVAKPKAHPEFVLFYKILNESLKHYQPKLTYTVDRMPANEFVDFYKGLKYIHGFKIDLQSKSLDMGGYSEYIVLDLASYTGPRSVELVMFEEPTREVVPGSAAQLYRDAGRYHPSHSAFRSTQNHFNVVSLFGRPKPAPMRGNPAHKVVDLSSYRKNRVINYIAGDTEGA